MLNTGLILDQLLVSVAVADPVVMHVKCCCQLQLTPKHATPSCKECSRVNCIARTRQTADCFSTAVH
jgi:hypothetical protein